MFLFEKAKILKNCKNSGYSSTFHPQHLLNNAPVIAQSGYLVLSAKLVFLFQPFVEMPLG
jgi:hypothetical protein